LIAVSFCQLAPPPPPGCYSGERNLATGTFNNWENTSVETVSASSEDYIAPWYSSSSCCPASLTYTHFVQRMMTYFDGECNFDPFYDINLDNITNHFLRVNFTTGFQLFSQGCQDQFRIFFAGLLCSPNWPLYAHEDIFDVTIQDYVTKFSICSRFINSLFAACRYEKLPASMINYIPRSRGFSPVKAGYNSNDTLVCTTFAEVFQTASNFMYWADITWTSNFTGNGYTSALNLPFGLYYDTLSSKTCFGAASALTSNVLVFLTLLLILLLI